MKKVLALMLAAMMLLTLNVSAMAVETASDIVAYGGGGPLPVMLEEARGKKLELERPTDETVENDIPIKILTTNDLEDNNVTISFESTDFDFQFVRKVENYETTSEPTINYNAWEYLAKPKVASVAAGQKLNGTIKVEYFYSSDADRKLTDEFTLTIAPIIAIDDVGPGETIEFTMSANYMNAMGDIRAIGRVLEYVSSYDISSVTCKNGSFIVEAPDDEVSFYDQSVSIKPSTLYPNASDVGKTISDVLQVKLSNGKTYEFPTEMTINDRPFQDLDRTEPCLNAQDTILDVMVGTTYHYTIKIVDITNTLKVPLSIDFDNENEDVLRISNVTINGKEIAYILTPLKEGTAEITHVIKDMEGNDLGWHTETYTVYPEGGIIPDDIHNPDPDQPKPPVTDPDDPNQPKPPVTDPEDPNQPTTPDRPNPPVLDSGASDDKAPQATDNAANDDKTGDALRSGSAAEVKLSNGSAGISVDTANLLGGGSGKLTLVNNGMTVVLPGGFGKVTEAGRIYYPFDYEQNPKHASDMLSAVKGENARSEAVKAGGVMTLPTTATVTLKTRLTGTVNVYYYNEDTGKFTLVASPAAKDGTVTFATRQMGYFLLTTGRI